MTKDKDIFNVVTHPVTSFSVRDTELLIQILASRSRPNRELQLTIYYTICEMKLCLSVCLHRAEGCFDAVPRSNGAVDWAEIFTGC